MLCRPKLHLLWAKKTEDGYTFDGELINTTPKHITTLQGVWDTHPDLKSHPKLLSEWEEKHKVPEYELASEILKLKGGVADLLYYRLVEHSVRGMELPAFCAGADKVEEDDDDDDHDFVDMKMPRGYTNPTSEGPEREKTKKFIAIKAKENQDIVEKANAWRSAFRTLWKKCGNKGMVPDRFLSNDKQLKCEDGGAARQQGKVLAAKKRALKEGKATNMKFNLPNGKAVDVIEIEKDSKQLDDLKMELRIEKMAKEHSEKKMDALTKENNDMKVKCKELERSLESYSQKITQLTAEYSRAAGKLQVLELLFEKDQGVSFTSRGRDISSSKENTPSPETTMADIPLTQARASSFGIY